MTRTKTDPSSILSAATDDEPFQLRIWGSERVYAFPPPQPFDWSIGSRPDSWLTVQDAEQFVSRHHATLRYDGAMWTITDAESKNGLWIDGQRAASATLAPGTEIGVGRIRLIVESPRLVQRRRLIARLLGWSAERQLAVDRALRAVREFVASRVVLWITGNDHLAGIAKRIHDEVCGRTSPFVVRDLEPNAIENAMQKARGGTLCVTTRRVQRDGRLLRTVVADRELPCRIVVCAPTADQVTSIDIPPLSSRPSEIERIIDEYAADAITELGAAPNSFVGSDRDLVLRDPPPTLGDIASATLRLVAVREFGGVTNAAARLGISHPALSRWLARRLRVATRTRP